LYELVTLRKVTKISEVVKSFVKTTLANKPSRGVWEEKA
jgi:hypothetical protein